MKEFLNCTIQIPVDFILQTNKQHVLINFILKRTPLTIPDLSKILDISTEKLSAVRNKKNHLTPSESKRLVEYFCICSGN